MTDPIADMLTNLRNAAKARKPSVTLTNSKVKKAIADIFLRLGFLESVEVVSDTFNKLVLKIKYYDKEPAITAVDRVSKPGHRVYRKRDEMPRVINDYGYAIVSTSAGIMTNKEAEENGLGGEIICSIY